MTIIANAQPTSRIDGADTGWPGCRPAGISQEILADQLDPDGGSVKTVRAALAAAFRLGRRSNPAMPEEMAQLDARISAGPDGDPWFAVERLLTSGRP